MYSFSYDQRVGNNKWLFNYIQHSLSELKHQFMKTVIICHLTLISFIALNLSFWHMFMDKGDAETHLCKTAGIGSIILVPYIYKIQKYFVEHCLWDIKSIFLTLVTLCPIIFHISKWVPSTYYESFIHAPLFFNNLKNL
jgi:hypothetical protein